MYCIYSDFKVLLFLDKNLWTDLTFCVFLNGIIKELSAGYPFERSIKSMKLFARIINK
jgi:hypothetical protein